MIIRGLDTNVADTVTVLNKLAQVGTELGFQNSIAISLTQLATGLTEPATQHLHSDSSQKLSIQAYLNSSVWLELLKSNSH